MVVSIRLPSSDTTLPTHYSYPRGPRSSGPPRILRRLLPLILIFILLLLELYRLFLAPGAATAATAAAAAAAAAAATAAAPSPASPKLPSSVISLPARPPHPDKKTLIVLACHGIFLGAGDGSKPGEWTLAPYQRHSGQHRTFVAHLERAVRLLSETDGALLLISGAQTNPFAGPVSEAASYHRLAVNRGLIAPGSELYNRSLTEERALDSYQNLAFSTCRFRQLAGRYPDEIVVVGFAFKKERFEEIHRTGMGWTGGWRYEGVDPEWDSEEKKRLALDGEARARDEWKACGAELDGKRKGRNWIVEEGARGYVEACPEMDGVWQGCGGGRGKGPFKGDGGKRVDIEGQRERERGA